MLGRGRSLEEERGREGEGEMREGERAGQEERSEEGKGRGGRGGEEGGRRRKGEGCEVGLVPALFSLMPPCLFPSSVFPCSTGEGGSETSCAGRLAPRNQVAMETQALPLCVPV